MTALQATVTKFMSLADGTLRIQVDIHHKDNAEALQLLCSVGRQVAVAALADSGAGKLPDGATIEPVDEVAAELVERATNPPAEDECQPHAGKLMSQLYRAGWFQNPRVYAVLGHDKEFLQWLRKENNCAACDHPGSQDNPIVAAHYRKVSDGAGTGIKPEYSAVALCDRCHQKQHAQGYSALAPIDTWEKWVAMARQMWGHDQLRRTFGATSMTAVPASMVLQWLDARGLMRTLPQEFQ